MKEYTQEEIDCLIAENERSKKNSKEQKTSSYLTDCLHDLLCDRYNLGRHTDKQKLIDLVVKELSI